MTNLGNKEVMAKNLKKYVAIFGKSQKELAEIVGVSPSTFNDWVQAKKYPRIDKIEIMANYFGILKSDLIEERKEERIQMQKNNDTITDVIVKMRSDEEFRSVVSNLMALDAEQMSAVKQLLLVLKK